MMAHAFNASICEADLGAPGQPGLHIGFQANQSNTVRSCLKNKEKNPLKIKQTTMKAKHILFFYFLLNVVVQTP